jgi:hypothetical protein
LVPTATTAGASRVASGLLCLHAVAITPAGSMELIRSSISIASGLPRVTVRSAFAIVFSRPAQRSLTLRLHARRVAKRPSTPKAPTGLLPPPPLRLLPGGANQFPGGISTRSSPAPFTAHCYANLLSCKMPTPSPRLTSRLLDPKIARRFHTADDRPDHLPLSHRRETRRWRDGRCLQSRRSQTRPVCCAQVPA